MEIKLNQENKISGYSWKKQSYETIEEAYEAQTNPPKKSEAPAQEAYGIQKLVLKMAEPPLEEEWTAFREWLKGRDEGRTTVEIQFPLSEKTIDVAAIIFNTDVESIKELLPEAEVSGE